MNTCLTNLIDKIKDYSNFNILTLSDLRKKPVKEQNIEFTMKTRDEELRNHDKMTRNFYFEYEQMQKRVDKVNDPLYLTELRRKKADLDSRIKTLNKEQKNL